MIRAFVLCPLHQLQGRGQSKTALACKRDGFEFGASFAAGAGKADADLIAAEHRILAFRRRMLLVDDFAFPAAVRAGVGAEIIEERVAAENAAVKQEHNAGQAAVDAIERAEMNGVEPVDDAACPTAPTGGRASSSSRVSTAQNSAPGTGAALPSKRMLLPCALPRTLIAATSAPISGL